MAREWLVEQTIDEHCRMRGWYVHAVACRAQHVHVVLTATGCIPDDVLRQLKAWCTRRLKEQQSKRTAHGQAGVGSLSAERSRIREKWWTQGGSRRNLYDESGLAAAIV